MKKNILATLSLVALTVFSAAAQTDGQHYRSVNAQLFGPPNAISLNYDARFKQGSQWASVIIKPAIFLRAKLLHGCIRCH